MRKEVLFLFAILLISSASAEITFGHPKSLYNAGDEFTLPITLTTSSDASAFLTAELVCGQISVDLYKSPVTLKQGAEKKIEISTSLGNFLVSGINGECYVRAEFAGSSSNSQTFEISNNVDVNFDVTGLIFSPGEAVILKGKAVKSNDEFLQGFAEISVPGLSYTFVSAVKDGSFNTTFVIPENAKSASYEINVKAYDKDADGLVINSGSAAGTIKVRQVMKNLEIALDADSVSPGNEVSFSVLAYDQAQDFIGSETSVSILSSSGNEIKKLILNTGVTEKFLIERNFEPGNWKIVALAGTFESKKEFSVAEVRKVEYTLENNSLVVVNTGNVPYSGFLEIFLNGLNEVKQIKNLEVGSSKTFKLAAPDGDYTIEVTDGKERVGLGTAFLTGRAVSVTEVGTVLKEKWLVIFWTAVIIALLVLVVTYYRRIAKKKFIGMASGACTPQKYSAEKSPGVATQSGVLSGGQKQECAIISLYIKNLEGLGSVNSDGLKVIDSALWQAKESGAKIYTEGKFRIAVVTPALTKEVETSLKGVRIAEQIERIINEYNKRSAQRVDFGVAVNVGELIYESVGGKFKFVSPDNSLVQAKKLSTFSNKDVILSEKAHAKTFGKIKSIKLQDKQLWKLEKIVDRTAHIDFINRFKQENKKFKL